MRSSAERFACCRADPEQGLAVAYRSEDDGGSAVRLATLRLVRGDEPRIERVESPVTLPAIGEIVAGPSVSYAPVGFAAPGSGKALGGWAVTWVEHVPSDGPLVDRVMAMRVAEAELHGLGEPIELAHGSVSQPFTYSKQASAPSASLHSGFLDSETLHLKKLSCP